MKSFSSDSTAGSVSCENSGGIAQVCLRIFLLAVKKRPGGFGPVSGDERQRELVEKKTSVNPAVGKNRRATTQNQTEKQDLPVACKWFSDLVSDSNN